MRFNRCLLIYVQITVSFWFRNIFNKNVKKDKILVYAFFSCGSLIFPGLQVADWAGVGVQAKSRQEVLSESESDYYSQTKFRILHTGSYSSENGRF